MKIIGRKIMAIFLALSLGMILSCSVGAVDTYPLIGNANYYGYYHDNVNEEGVIGISANQIYLNAFYHYTGEYVRGICTAGGMTATKFTATSSAIKECDKDGYYTGAIITDFVANGKVTIGTAEIKIIVNGHTYVYQR